MSNFKVGDLVASRSCGGSLGRLGRPVRIGRTDGWVVTWSFRYVDQGMGSGPEEVAEMYLQLAVIGETVCPEPVGTHSCGLVHLPVDQLDRVRRAGSQR